MKNEEPKDVFLKEDEEKEERKEEKMQDLKIIAKVVGDDCGLKVEIGKKGWRYIFKPIDKIEVDGDDIENKGRDYCLGLICHEGAHKKISRVDFIPKKIWREAGFKYLINAVEDPRVNNWVSEKYDGARNWLNEVYNEDIGGEQNFITENSQKKIGYTPKHIKFGLEVIRYWYTRSFSDNLPKDVKKALEETINYIELAYGSIPESIDPSEENISEMSQRMYKIVYSSVWPEYQKLVEQSFEDEKKRQMIKDMLENGEIDLDQESQSSEGEPLPIDELPEEIREEVEKKIKEKLDSLPEEEKEKLSEKINQKAKENLEELEDEINKDLKGKFNEQLESESEEAKKEKQSIEEKKAREEIEKIREEIESKVEKEKTEYMHAYQEVKKYIDEVVNDIIELLIAKRWPRFKKSFPGQKLRLKGAMKYESRRDYRDLFEKRGKAEKNRYNFILLVDLSGSMRGAIEETFKGVVLFVEALNKIEKTLGGVKVSVCGFQNDLLRYKDFDEDLNDTKREKISLMKEEVHNNNASWNNDGYCLEKVKREAERLSNTENFLFVLSDGLPAGDNEHHIPGYSKETEDDELHAVVKAISQENKIRLLAIGLGEGTSHVRNFYSDKLNNVSNIANINIKDLPRLLKDKIKKLIK